MSCRNILLAMLMISASGILVANTNDNNFQCPNGNMISIGDSVDKVVKACGRDQTTDNRGFLVARPSVVRWSKVTTQVTYNKDNQPVESKKVKEDYALVTTYDQKGKPAVEFQFLDDRLVGKAEKDTFDKKQETPKK